MNSARTEPRRTLVVTVNDQVYTLLADSTLADLITQLGLATDRIATALNGEFVARDLRDGRHLCDGDKVTCFQAIVGG